MKTKEVTVENAFAWSKQVLLSKLKKDKGDCIVLDADIARTLEDPYTMYYEDAIQMALLDYILKKRGVLVDEKFKVTVLVRGKGTAGVIPMTIGPIFGFGGNDIETLKQDLVIPTTRKLVAEASKDFPFSKVESVTCYVEEVDSREDQDASNT